MKIKTKHLSYNKVMQLDRPKHRLPLRPVWLLQLLVRIVSGFELLATKFTYRTRGMEKLGKKEPCLILMNHSCFMDLKIASKIFFPRRYGIVCTKDGFIGRSRLMRWLGCIPTLKFYSDIAPIGDMEYMLKEKKTSVLMFPEVSYSFDGRQTPLPRKMGALLKKLDVPVVTVITKGAFARDPLYNGLQKRKVKVSADVTYLLSREDIRQKSVRELSTILDETFHFDSFAWQKENNVQINEPFRADGLHRVLYRCPHCGKEGRMEGKGILLTCRSCGKAYELTPLGQLQAQDGQAVFTHIPNWYAWQRGLVRNELENGTYRLETRVDIGVQVDYKALYLVGRGKLVHDENGFHLTGCHGKLDFIQGPLTSYSLNCDFYWYEMGDVICIGNRDVRYYCFPKSSDVVTKTRLAAEELYKLKKRRKATV